eukprot:752181-Hanusia_phi.AAC.2
MSCLFLTRDLQDTTATNHRDRLARVWSDGHDDRVAPHVDFLLYGGSPTMQPMAAFFLGSDVCGRHQELAGRLGYASHELQVLLPAPTLLWTFSS